MNLIDLPALVLHRVIAGHLDSAGKKSLARTCRALNLEVDHALSPPERQVKNAWRAISADEDGFVAQLGDCFRVIDPATGAAEPLARRVAALSAHEPSAGPMPPQPADERARRQVRYLRLQRHFGLASELLGGQPALSAPVGEEDFGKVVLLLSLGDRPEPWPPSLLKLLAASPCFFKEEVEPEADVLAVRGHMANLLANYPFLSQGLPTGPAVPDPSLMYPVAVHPNAMRGELAWGADPRRYVFVALAGSVMAPCWRESAHPAADTVYTYSWSPVRGDWRWERAISCREGGRVYGGLYPGLSGRLVNDPSELTEVSAHLARHFTPGPQAADAAGQASF